MHFLYQHTPLIIIPTICTLLFSTRIKRASTCFGTYAPSSGRTQCQFLETKCDCKAAICVLPKDGTHVLKHVGEAHLILY